MANWVSASVASVRVQPLRLVQALPQCTASSENIRMFSTSSSTCKPRRQRNRNNPFALHLMKHFQYDDVPTFGHLKLQKQRQLLDYYRLLENEVPQLRQYHEPFQPAAATDVLQFHFTHYQGEPHPGAQKVVLTANVHELWKVAKLNSPQARHKFLLLAGTRWQPADLDVVHNLNSALKQGGDALAKAYNTHSLGSIRIGCNRYPHETQNMKWCSDVLDKMVAEAQTEPSLTDVPLDIRPYIRSNARGGPVARASAADFPKEWL